MTKKQKWAWATALTLLLLILFLVYYFKTRKQGEKCPDGRSIPLSGNCSDNPPLLDRNGNTIVGSSPVDLNGCTQPSSYITNSFPLALGMKGTMVEQLQLVLNTTYGANLKPDGYFGCHTLAEVKKAFGVDVVDAELYKNKIQAPVPILG